MSAKLILNGVIPQDLRLKIEEDAIYSDITMNAAAVRVICNHYGVLAPSSSGRYRRLTSDRFKLRVPEKLHHKMRVEAARSGSTMRGLALSALSAHYGTEAISPKRRPRKEAT